MWQHWTTSRGRGRTRTTRTRTQIMRTTPTRKPQARTTVRATKTRGEGRNDPKGEAQDNDEDDEKPPVELTVAAIDADGDTARVSLTDYGPLRRPLTIRVMRRRDLERDRFGTAWELILQHFSIPAGGLRCGQSRLRPRHPARPLARLRPHRGRNGGGGRRGVLAAAPGVPGGEGSAGLGPPRLALAGSGSPACYRIATPIRCGASPWPSSP